MRVFRVTVTRQGGRRFCITTEDHSPEAAAVDIAKLCGREPKIEVVKLDVEESTERGWEQRRV